MNFPDIKNNKKRNPPINKQKDTWRISHMKFDYSISKINEFMRDISERNLNIIAEKT